MNQFKKNNEYEIRELTDDMIDRVLQMQEAWCELRDCAENPSLNSEDMAVYEAMSQFDELGFKGLAVLIDDKVEGFALGEALNPETVVIHVEKANPEIRGLYAAVNNFFCRDFWSDYRYINREQDLGVEGLRKAKESYKPDHLVEKYDVFPK